MRSAFDKMNDHELQQLLDESTSLRDVLIKMNLSARGGNSYDSIRKRIKRSNLSTDMFAINTNKQQVTKKRKIEHTEVFCKESTLNRHRVKERILKEKLIPYMCSDCGLSNVWNDKKLVLQIDHINGVKNDNRIENLRFLCPNCHSQTETFTAKRLKREHKIYTCNKCGGIKKGKESTVCNACHIRSQPTRFNITKSKLYELRKNQNMTLASIGKLYNVSDNTVLKYIRKWNIS